MDYNTPNGYGPTAPQPPRQPVREKGQVFAVTALVLGILSILTLCCVTPPFILGGVGITLALLSRGGGKEMSSSAMSGLILSAIGSAVSLGIVIFAFGYILLSDPDYPDSLIEEYKYFYEYDFNENGDGFPGNFNNIFPGNSGDL